MSVERVAIFGCLLAILVGLDGCTYNTVSQPPPAPPVAVAPDPAAPPNAYVGPSDPLRTAPVAVVTPSGAVMPVPGTPAVAPVARQEVKIRAKGAGVPPARAINTAQARLMAERAAVVDGYRNLLEQAYGLQVTGSTTVRDFATQSDTIRTQVDAFVRGAKVVDTRYVEDGAVETEMEITLSREFWALFSR